MSYMVRKIGFLPPYRYRPVVNVFGRTFVDKETFVDEGLALADAKAVNAILETRGSHYITTGFLDTLGWREEG